MIWEERQEGVFATESLKRSNRLRKLIDDDNVYDNGDEDDDDQAGDDDEKGVATF